MAQKVQRDLHTIGAPPFEPDFVAPPVDTPSATGQQRLEQVKIIY